MKKLICFITAIFLTPAIALPRTFSETDAVNLSLGKYGSTPNLYNSCALPRQAQSALINSLCINIQYRNHYFLPELGHAKLGVIVPAKKLNLGFYFEHYGLAAYSEFSAGVSFAKFFKPYFAFSLSAEYFGLYQSSEKGVLSSGMAHLSLMAFPAKGLSLGFSAYNISFSPLKSASGTQKLPVMMSIGAAYAYKQKLSVSVEAGKEIRGPVYYAAGIEYLPVKAFALRVGMSGQDAKVSPTAGFGFRIGAFGLDFGCRYDFDLGIIMGAGISYCKN